MRLIHLILASSTLAACGDGTGDDTDGVINGDPYAGLPPPAELPPYSGGKCPDMSGEVTGFESADSGQRSFQLHVPKKADGVGVLFLWHGNGDSASNFDRYMDGEGLAKQLKVITVIPEAGAGGLGMDWSAPPNNPDGDATFFDDMLACLDEQYDVDLRRVYTSGFSAGAIWSSWLVLNRAEYLAAGVIFSGGSDGTGGFVNPYETPASDIPVLMTEGGPTDIVIVNFKDMTRSMSSKLRADGSTVVVCSHDQGHTPPSGYDRWAWDFLDAHVWGRSPSPYADGADPSGDLPGWCAWE